MTNLTSSQTYYKILKGINDMPEKELLKQEGYYNLLDTVAVSMLRKGEKPIHLVCSSTESNATGCTDGTSIYINTWSPIVLDVEKMDEYIKTDGSDDWAALLPKKYNVRHLMYLVNIGTTAHEFGHVMYTDFNELNRMKERFIRGSFVGCANREKLERLAGDYRFANPLVNGIFDLMNIVEDCYIENCLCLDYSRQGNVVRGLETGNLIKFFSSMSTVELEKRIEEGQMLLSDAFNWLLQIRDCLGYEPKDYKKASGYIHDMLTEALDRALPICKSYKESSHNHEEEIYQLIDIFSELFPDPEILNQLQSQEGEGGQSGESGEDNEDQQSGNGGNGGDSNDDSNNENQKKCQQLVNCQIDSKEHEEAREEAKKNSGQSSDDMFGRAGGSAKRNPTKENSEAEQEAVQAEADKAREAAKSNSVEDEDIAKEIAKEILEEIKAKVQASELQDEYDRAAQEVLHTVGCDDARVTRETVKATPQMKKAYDDIYKNVEKTAKTCVRKVSQILDKREFDEEESGFVQGFKFNAHEAYRKDRKVFSRQLEPDSKPDVAFSIMVDESGSMWWNNKCQKAREAAILFDAISRGLDIPTQIVGHTEDYHPIAKLYRNFDSSEKEKYALTQITADGGNIDTVILTGLCEQILARPEEKKVVIVISDGAPCRIENGIDKESFNGVRLKDQLNCRRGMDYASRELNACVRYYRKKGVKIIGIAVDELEDIRGIYEEGTLDCTDLNKLPNELVKIFKRYVLK